MFNATNGYSLSDIAAVSRSGDNGWGSGDGAWWLILLFLFAGNGYGWGGFGGGGSTFKEEIAYGFDMNGLSNGIRGIQQGLCDGFYAVNSDMLTGFSNVQNALCQNFAGVNSAITQGTIADMQNTFGLQTAINNGTTAISTQLAGMAADNAACCCATQRAIEGGFADLGYNLATQSCDTRHAIADSTRDIIDNNNAGIRSILEFLTQDKIASLQAENQTLKFTASQQSQSNYLVNALRDPYPVPAYVVPHPGYYNNISCGCGC